MARAPDRRWPTYFLGAGFSRSVGLPNTAELLADVHGLARREGLVLDEQLKSAYRYFYPEEAASFVPEVVDFFSVLRANEDVAKGMPGSFAHPELLNELRLAVARLLCERTRDLAIPPAGWAGVERIVRPGSVIITSNWDLFIEVSADARGVPLRLGGQPSAKHVTLLKLHGSIDWTHADHRRRDQPDEDFAALREMQNPARPYSVGIEGEQVLRIRAMENMTRSWQFIKARTTRPLMITMSLGKTVDMEPIHRMWEDAYYALSAARYLQIIGYSMPADDIEIRTLLRAGIAAAQVTVMILRRRSTCVSGRLSRGPLSRTTWRLSLIGENAATDARLRVATALLAAAPCASASDEVEASRTKGPALSLSPSQSDSPFRSTHATGLA